jgi:murein DD-endopeptidase MepM/ murein hydrolase activator NlpD
MMIINKPSVFVRPGRIGEYFRIGVACIFFGYLCVACRKTVEHEEAGDEPAVDSEWVKNEGHLFEYGICIDSLNTTKYVIESGDHLSGIFSRMGFSAKMVDSLCRSAGETIDPTRLRSGSLYETLTTQDSAAVIRYIVFAKSRTDFSIIDLTGDSIATYEYNKEVHPVRCYMEGSITSSLWNVVKANGTNPLLALKISDILAWQVDFFDVKNGDAFRVVYDVAYIDDTTSLDDFNVIGLVFVHQGKAFTAISFTQDRVREYFDAEGNTLRRAFLKAPLDFSRITSRFSNARFHPILKRYRAHHGVDYAAPTGTPVKAIGDGTVIAKGYEAKGGGNYVKVRHNAVYTTTYMHLSRFGKGLRNGAFVKQGAVIGYVGSTGLSTGPHLDFRVHKNGQPIDPLKMESPPAAPVKAELRDSFEIVKRGVLAEMDSLRSVTTELAIHPQNQNTL